MTHPMETIFQVICVSLYHGNRLQGNSCFGSAEPNMLKILSIIPSKFLTYYSYFIPTSSPIIPTYSCNFYCIGDNNVNNTHSDCYTGE